MYKQI